METIAKWFLEWFIGNELLGTAWSFVGQEIRAFDYSWYSPKNDHVNRIPWILFTFKVNIFRQEKRFLTGKSNSPKQLVVPVQKFGSESSSWADMRWIIPNGFLTIFQRF